jgi:hypothetical protein
MSRRLPRSSTSFSRSHFYLILILRNAERETSALTTKFCLITASDFLSEQGAGNRKMGKLTEVSAHFSIFPQRRSGKKAPAQSDKT